MLDIFIRIKKRIKLVWKVLRTGNLSANETREIPNISSEEISEIKETFPMDKFFVFGHARSGTTLLLRLIRLHPKIHGNYQGHFFTRPPLLSKMVESEEMGEWLSRRSNRWNRGRDMTPVALRAMVDYIMERDAKKEGKTIVGDKSPNALMNGRSVVEASRIYPDAKLFYIVRDGRDVAVSHRINSFIVASQFLNKNDIRIHKDFLANSEDYFLGEKSIFTKKEITHLTESWVKNINETEQKGKEIYGDQYHSLRFEDLTEKPFETISVIWKFLGVETEGMEKIVESEMRKNPDADWQKKVASELISPLEKGKSGSWKDLFTEEDKNIFKGIAGDELIKWGYEKDFNW